MNWMSADLCGRDVRKIFAPKTVEYKRPRGRPLKYRGYDFEAYPADSGRSIGSRSFRSAA
jgi:hypothetical protein